MPVYEYSAISPKGKELKGSVDAESLRSARQKLRAQGIFATDIQEGKEVAKKGSRDVKRYFQSNRVSPKDLAVSTRQLATLLKAGLPLVTALHALSDQTDSKVLQRIVVEVKENVEEGTALAKALGAFPKVYPRLYVNMVNAGEASGTLDAVLEKVADYLEAQLELRRRVRGALTYPVLMLGICVIVVSCLFVFVVPKVVTIFEKQGAALPMPTRIMLAISNFLTTYWYLPLLGIVCGLALFRWYYRQERGRKKIDRIILNLPIAGGIYRKVCTARVAGTLSTLLASGVGLLAALDITKNIVGNVHVISTIESARHGVEEGKSLAKELGREKIFPSMLSHMVAVGEKSGELEDMLGKVARAYEEEVRTTLSGLTTLLEPLMMIGVGGVVLCIVIAVLMPMVELINIIQK